jgi:hypothetical protein
LGTCCRKEVYRGLAVAMKRQEWRRWLKLWRKIPCFRECTAFVSFDALPHTAVDFQLKVSDDLVFEFNLDMFMRWRLYLVLIVNGFPVRQGFHYNIGVASDAWFEMVFGEDEDVFWL